MPGSNAAAGYSGSPLIKKLGIKPDMKIAVWNEPAAYWHYLSPLPSTIRVLARVSPGAADMVHLFATTAAHFNTLLRRAKPLIHSSGMIWVSWPKKASGVPSDLDENMIRSAALKAGLVDVKVCAVDEVWSGLKLLYRLKDR
jgi:hypothetical protein